MRDLHADLARCDAEIALCLAELETVGPEEGGALLGLHDWSWERRLLERQILPALVREVEEAIASGHSDACLIPWAAGDSLFGDSTAAPATSIEAAVSDFRDAGWAWTGQQLEKDGWYAFFRSQGELAPPILQWQRIAKAVA